MPKNTSVLFFLEQAILHTFVYTGSLSAAEIEKEYKSAIKEALRIAFEEGNMLEYRQKAAMRILSEKLEGFVFNENV